MVRSSFTALALGALFACSQYAEAFSPAARSRVLSDLKDMRMTGAGGAATPDTYVEGEYESDIFCGIAMPCWSE